MFTNDKILYFLKYLKQHNGKTLEHLEAVIKTHLSINFGTTADTFINHVEEKGFISYERSDKCYYITNKGKSFIIKQEVLKYTKKFIT